MTASCDQPPPSLEQSIIGSIIAGGRDAFATCQSAGLSGDWFADPQCRRIYEVFAENSSGPIDIVLAWDELHRRSLMPTEISRADFCRLTDHRCATSLTLGNHIDQLRLWHSSRVRRSLFAAGAHEESPGADPEPQTKRIADLAATFVSPAQDESLATAAAQYGHDMALPRPKVDPMAIRTLLTDLDRVFGPILPSQLILLGARPSLGKSSLARQISLAAAQNQFRVHFESLEMTASEFAKFGSHQLARVPLPAYGESLPTDLTARVRAAAAQLTYLPISLTAASRLTPMLAAWEARMTSSSPPGLFILDYLQLLDPEASKGENRDQALGRVSKALKRFAMRWRVPILALSAIGRASERDERPPTIADLRESGSLEGDADRIWILHRPSETSAGTPQDYNDPSLRTFEVHLSQLKARGAPTGRISLVFDRRTTLFA